MTSANCCGSCSVLIGARKHRLHAVVKFACDAIFASICTFPDCAGPCRAGFQEAKQRERSGSIGSIRTATETLAQFLVIDLWIALHVEANKGNKVALFWWTSKLWRVVSLYIPPPTCRQSGWHVSANRPRSSSLKRC